MKSENKRTPDAGTSDVLKADITEWAVSAFILREMEVICK